MNLVDHFVDRHIREGRGGKAAIVCDGRTFTYSEIAALVNRVGSGLREVGIQEEQRVLVLLPDGPEFAAAYFGAMKIGAVAVPTSTALRAADYAYFLGESRARVVLVHPSLAELVDPKRRIVITDEWLARQSSELETVAMRKDDAAFWLWTSGSTGTPKGAVHLHQDWMHCCENYARGVLGITEQDRTFSSSKLFHAYGLGNGLMFPFHVGATTILHSAKPQARSILELAQRSTLFFSVPTLYAAMLEVEGSFDLSGVRLAASAAEPLPGEIFRRWKERFNVEILDGVGSTEALHIYISARPGKVKPGSTGQPVPGYSIRIVDELNADVAPGTIGDLLVRGGRTICFGFRGSGYHRLKWKRRWRNMRSCWKPRWSRFRRRMSCTRPRRSSC